MTVDADLEPRPVGAPVAVARRRPEGAGPGAGDRLAWVVLVSSVAGLVVGGLLHLAGAADSARWVWAAVTLLGVGPTLWWVLDAARHRRLGVDLVALLALLGTLAVGESLAGALISVMLGTGRSLEAWASARARRSMTALLQRAPREAHRRVGDGLETVDVGLVVPGDVLLVKPGEVVPTDGVLVGGAAVLDESALTGEAVPVERGPGEPVRSGAVNGGGPFELRATTTAAASTYAGILRLVAEAEATSAPFVRLADRWAGGFLALSLALAALAGLAAGDLGRAVAVLVVATPCPLILAAPVAVVAGLSNAASRGVVVKDGAALEQLARTEVLLLDKTGTLTAGHPTVVDVVAPGAPGPDELLRLVASLDQTSPHVLAAAIVAEAGRRGLELSLPTGVEEVAGQGISGVVDGGRVAVGRAAWVAPGRPPRWVGAVRRRADLDGLATVFASVDGELAGVVLLEDRIRPDAARTVRQLRADGIRRVVVVTGDRAEVAEAVGAVVGVDEVLAERTPADKVEAVRFERRYGPTAMVGDGINDAPALAVADVGVAVATAGPTASSESADVLLTRGRLDRLGEARRIAVRSRRIARQSVLAGVGLSATAMLVAAGGWLPATWGALLQEGIDAAVILNALRALRRPPGTAALRGPEAALVQRFAEEHRQLEPQLAAIRTAAEALGEPTAGAVARARDVHRWLVEVVAPHESAEEHELYPALAAVLGGSDPTGTMSREHAEIARRIRRLGRLLEGIDDDAPAPEDVAELQRALHGLHAILELHFDQEDEGYLSLGDEDAREGGDRPARRGPRPGAAPRAGPNRRPRS